MQMYKTEDSSSKCHFCMFKPFNRNIFKGNKSSIYVSIW